MSAAAAAIDVHSVSKSCRRCGRLHFRALDLLRLGLAPGVLLVDGPADAVRRACQRGLDGSKA